METAFAFRLEDLQPYLFCGGALGLVAGVLAVMFLRRRGFFKRPSMLWGFTAKLEYVWTPVAFAGGFAAIAAVIGMAHLTMDFIASDKAAVDRMAANSVDAVLAEVADKVRGSGMGEEAFLEIARVATDAAAEGAYGGIGSDPAYARVLYPARRRVSGLLKEFFSMQVKEAQLAGAVSDAAVLCDVLRPMAEDAILEGEVSRMVREGSSGIFTPLYFYSLGILMLLLAPCLLENLCHVLFRTAAPLIQKKAGAGPDRDWPLAGL
ncbi:MAG: hypothetical protein LBT40_15290 [Deltaproteobacteria bacterium]|jgi:hypothetical protein|nr:hypothetical protein [Deltaproteobacteria bacterium]